MKRLDYWSKETNPITGDKFEAFLAYLKVAHNGSLDIDRFLDSEYGEAFANNLHVRFTFEADAMGEPALAYYESLGLKKEMFQPDDYYERWTLFTPLDMVTEAGKGKKYPLVFSHHGGGSSIETEEFSSGYTRIAGKEGFMVAFLQNSNWQNMERIIGVIREKYPLDTERIYVSGFSQGGYQTHSAYFRIPEKITAVAPCGNDIYRPWDNFDVPYTDAELDHLREVFVPFFQMTGVSEASSFVPLTDWKPRKKWDEIGQSDTFIDPRKDDNIDPTRMHGTGFQDPVRASMMPEVKWGQCTPPTPPPGRDKHEWMMDRINKRMWLLGCEPRAAETCLSYANTPEDELHHVIGIYGDRESIEEYCGYKHYTIDIRNKDGMLAFRYVTVENSPHWPYLMMGELAWDFFKRYRRDSQTGKIVEETYIK